MLPNNYFQKNKILYKGFTLIELLISLGLILLILLSITTLAFNYTRYQAKRLEKVQVQENFRNTIRIITQELNSISEEYLLEPRSINNYQPDNRDMSFELYFRSGNTPEKVIRYHIVTTGRESQVFRTEYDASGLDWQKSWINENKQIILTREYIEEPVSDRIKAISHLLFTYKPDMGVVIFMVGELVNKTKVTYVSLAYPRN